MSKFDYPKLSLTEIVTILRETQISVITENDLKNPNMDLVSDLYTRLLIYLDILHEDDPGQLEFAALEQLENPDLHVGSVQVMSLYSRVKAVVTSINCPMKFTLKDLVRPDATRTEYFVSAILNFCLHNKMSTRSDPAWKYGHEIIVEDGKGGYKYIKCNFCSRTIKGGVYRMKEHLAGIKGNVAPCTMAPPEVQSEINDFMKKKQDTKKNAQLYREERIDEGVSLHRSAFGSSQESISKRTIRGPMDRYLVNIEEGELEDNPIRPSQGSVQDFRDQTIQDIGRFFYENGIAFNVASSPSFANMVRSIGNFGRGLKPPTAYELSTTILNQNIHFKRMMIL